MSEQNQDQSRYAARGVSAAKEDVHKAVAHLDKGLFPNTFVKAYPDYLGGDEKWCNLMSSDGSGTKSAIAYLYWKETGDVSVWEGIAEDVIVMNLDDLLCTGATDNFLFSSVINRNKHLIPGEVISAIIRGSSNFFDRMRGYGIEVNFLGGETADLGDLVRTITVDGSMTVRIPREKVVVNDIKPGQIIVGLASYGQASFENRYNSGIGSNGLTSARHDLLSKHYAERFPETFDPNTDHAFVYSGKHRLSDSLAETGLNIGQALLSPTRSFAPIVKEVLNQCQEKVHGIVHCTGGAQTKVLHFLDRYHVVKDKLFNTPPLFQLIQSDTQTSWEEMYKVFNMGNRMEFYCDPGAESDIISIASDFNIDAQVIGFVEDSEDAQVTVKSAHGTFSYKK